MSLDAMAAYVVERLPELWLRTGEHLMLTGCSTLAAMFIGIPMGILLFRTTWLRGPLMGVIGILQTIPSLAMLVFLLALLKKIGVLPALIALTLYALLPIVRNTLTGLDEVSTEVMEAAQGIGWSFCCGFQKQKKNTRERSVEALELISTRMSYNVMASTTLISVLNIHFPEIEYRTRNLKDKKG